MVATSIMPQPKSLPLPSLNEPSQALYGVAGWAYEDWNGIVYPASRSKGFKPLEYLMQFFEVLEINSSFYAIPSPHVTERWAQSALKKPGFEFTMKLWQGFTHERANWDEGHVGSFMSAAQPLQKAGVLGSILIQFPWSFKAEEENLGYLERLLDRLQPFKLTVEIRHSSWLRDEMGPSFRETLESRGVAFCNIDQPRLHDCIGLTSTVTAPQAYLRAHGRNAKCWFQQDADRNARYDYLYSAQEVGELAEVVRGLKKRAKKVYVIANNHWRGQAVANALQVKAVVEEKLALAPPQLLKHYGDLGASVVSDSTGQMEFL